MSGTLKAVALSPVMTTAKVKKSASHKLMTALGVAGAAAIAIVPVALFLDSKGLLPVPAEAPATPAATPAATPTPSPVAAKSAFQEALDRGMGAAVASQTATTETEWKNISRGWKEAADYLRQVPASDPHYAVAQQKIKEYEQNSALARGRSRRANLVSQTPTGLGINVRSVQAKFENAGFTFESSILNNGKPRVMGTSSDERAIVELIGQTEIQQATLMLSLSNDGQSNQVVVIYAIAFLEQTVPGWSGSGTWLAQAIDEIVAGHEKSAIVYGNKRIEMSGAATSTGLLSITVKPAQ